MVEKNKYLGSDFDDFLKEEGSLERTETSAIKRVISYQIKNAMHRKHLTKTSMAKRMQTSRSAVERLFDPHNESITLVTLNRAAVALGKRLKVELV
jgi:antitoxin HicB